MHLSEIAKKLLDENKITELQALPINELLAGFEPDQLTEYGFVREKLKLADQGLRALGGQMQSLASAYDDVDFADGAALTTVKDPVVISSGQIYSEATIARQLLLPPHEHKCIKTREPIDPNKIVRLPQITYALNLLELERNVDQLAEQKVGFELLIAGSKFRILFSEPTPSHYLADFLRGVFEGKQNSLAQVPQSAASYSGKNWSRVWGLDKLEFWFPHAYLSTLTNEDVAVDIGKILKPVNPSIEMMQPELDLPQNFNIQTLGHREYVTAFKEDLTYKQAGLCLTAFLLVTDEYRRKHRVTNDVDLVIGHRSAMTTRPQMRGLGVFDGSAPAHALSSYSALPSSSSAPQPSSQRALRNISSTQSTESRAPTRVVQPGPRQ